jgi:hypothetical protein
VPVRAHSNQVAGHILGNIAYLVAMFCGDHFDTPLIGFSIAAPECTRQKCEHRPLISPVCSTDVRRPEKLRISQRPA